MQNLQVDKNELEKSGFDQFFRRKNVFGKPIFQNRTIRSRITNVDTSVVNSNFIPDLDDSYDLGSDSNSFKDGYFSGRLYTNILEHTGTRVGFFGIDPVTKTEVSQINLLTSEALTDSTTGTASNTINDVGGAFNQGTLNNNLASIVDELTKLKADNETLRNKYNELRNVLDGYGLV